MDLYSRSYNQSTNQSFFQGNGKLNLMEPVFLKLDQKKSGEEDNTATTEKVLVSLSYDSLKDFEEAKSVSREVNHPAAIHGHQQTSLFYVNDQGKLILVSKNDDGLHPWVTRIVSDEVRVTKLTVKKFSTYKKSNGDISVAIYFIGTDREGKLSSEEIYFTHKLMEKPKDTKWIRCFSMIYGDPVNPISNISIVNHSSAPEQKAFILFDRIDRYNNNKLELRFGCVLNEDLKPNDFKFVDLPKEIRNNSSIIRPIVYRSSQLLGFYVAAVNKNGTGHLFQLEIQGSTIKVGQVAEHRNLVDLDTIITTKKDNKQITHIFLTTKESKFVVSHYVAGMPAYKKTVYEGNIDIDRLVAIEQNKEREEPTLYLTDRKGLLYKINNVTTLGKIKEPVLVTDNVVDMTAIVNKDESSSEVFVIKNNQQNQRVLERYYQTESIWKHEPILTEDHNANHKERQLHEIVMNIVKVTFKKLDKSPLEVKFKKHEPILRKVRLCASESISLKVNNVYHHFQKHVFKEFALDVKNTLSIALPFSHLHNPMLTIEADFLSHAFTFNTLADSYERLGKMNHKQSYKQPIDRFGGAKPNIVPNVPDERIDQAIKVVGEVHGVIKQSNHLRFDKMRSSLKNMPASEVAFLEEAAQRGVFVHDSGKGEHVGQNEIVVGSFNSQAFTIKPKAGIILFHDDEYIKNFSLALHTSESNVFLAIGDFFSHLYQVVKKQLVSAVTVVFEKANEAINVLMETVIDGVKQVFTAIVQTIEDVGNALRTVFNTLLDMAENAVIDVLSLFLPWQDIRETYKFIWRQFNTGYDQFKTELKNFNLTIDTFFKNAEKTVRDSLKAIEPHVDREKVSYQKVMKVHNKEKKRLGHEDKQDNLIEQLMHNPVFDWIENQLKKVLGFLPDVIDVTDKNLIEQIELLFKGKDGKGGFSEFVNVQKDNLEKIAKMLTLERLHNPGTFFEELVLQELLTFLLSTHTLSKSFVNFITNVLEIMMNMLSKKEIHLPFLTSIFRSPKCLAQQDSQASFMAHIVMLISVPACLLAKLVGVEKVFLLKTDIADIENDDAKKLNMARASAGIDLVVYSINCYRSFLSMISPYFGTLGTAAKWGIETFNFTLEMFSSVLKVGSLSLKLSLLPDAYSSAQTVFVNWTMLYKTVNFLIKRLIDAVNSIVKNIMDDMKSIAKAAFAGPFLATTTFDLLTPVLVIKHGYNILEFFVSILAVRLGDFGVRIRNIVTQAKKIDAGNLKDYEKATVIPSLINNSLGVVGNDLAKNIADVSGVASSLLQDIIKAGATEPTLVTAATALETARVSGHAINIVTNMTSATVSLVALHTLFT